MEIEELSNHFNDLNTGSEPQANLIFAYLSKEEKFDLLFRCLEPLIQQEAFHVQKASPLAPRALPQNNRPRQEAQPQMEVERGRSIQEEAKRKKPHQRYPSEVKAEAVELAVRINNNSEAARQVKEKYRPQNLYQDLSEKSVRIWRQDPTINKFQDHDQANSSRRQIRKLISPFLEAERQLVSTIEKKRSEGERVTKDFIVAEAKRTFNDNNFKGSPGWFSNFKKRWKISRRVPTKVIQKLADDYAGQVVEYLEKMRRVRFDFEKRRGKFIFGNMDQASLRFNMCDGSTYDFSGKKEIKLKTTMGSKLTFTAMLAVLSDGRRLPPILIFKTKSPIPKTLHKKYSQRALLYSNSKGWCNQEIMNNWLNKVWLNINVKQNERPFLVCDKFSVHQTEVTKKLLKDGGSEVAYIPAGCTGLMQPLDTHLNKPLKDHIRRSFESWYHTTGTKPENATTSGNLRAPSVETVIGWTIEAFESLSEDLVTRSFKHCGILFFYFIRC